jgi:hypothetical protein
MDSAPPAGTPAPSRLRAPSGRDLAALALVALAVAAFCAWYVSSERAIYSSDYANFHDAAVNTAIDLHLRLAGGPRRTLGFLAKLWRSTGWDYSLLPALLPAPAMLAFHGGRVAYVVTSALVYLVPFALVLGALAAALVPARPRTAFWTGVVVALTVPAIWAPTLRGYPDAGAAALTTGAAVLLVRDPSFRRRRTSIGIGVALTLAVLLRRHFAYPTAALLAVIAALAALSLIARLRAGGSTRPRDLITPEVGGAVRAALWFAASLLVFGMPFVTHALGNDYMALYASYMVSPGAVVGWLLWAFGGVAWLLALAGYLAAWRWRTLDRRGLALVLGIEVLTLAIWVFRVRQLGEHYALHVAPLVVLGQFALVWTIAQRVRGRARVALIAALVLFATVDFARGLAPLASIPASLRATASLAGSRPPLVRPDYDPVMRLVRDLRRVAGPRDPIYVASSGRLRASSLRSADRMLDDRFLLSARAGEVREGGRLNLPGSPHVDSRDENPVGAMVRATYVVIASPPQYQLAPDQQRVVLAGVEAFTRPWEIAADFVPTPLEYRLSSGASVRVFQRVRPTSLPVALRTFARVRATVQRAAEPTPLISLSRRQDAVRDVSLSTPVNADVSLGADDDTVPMILAIPANRGASLVAGAHVLGAGCGDVELSAAPLAGDSLPAAPAVATIAAGAERAVELPLTSAGSAVLLLLRRAPNERVAPNGCTVQLRRLTMRDPTASGT